MGNNGEVLISHQTKVVKLKKRKNSFIEEIKINKFLYILTLPGILFMLVFNYIPMFGIYIAFLDFNPIKGIFGSKFVGFDNFIFFFTGLDWPKVTLNTVYLNMIFIFAELFVAIMLAIMLNEMSKVVFKRVVQSIIILPYFVSWAVVAIFATTFLASDGGLVNTILEIFGKDSVSFYTTPQAWPIILVFVRIWKSAGYGTIIYLATMAGIKSEMYEAARIDGANMLDIIRYITLPMLKSTTILLVLLSLGRIFYGDFGMIYALVGDNSFIYSSTDVIDTFVYRALRNLGDFGMASAVGLYQSVVGFILVVITNKIVKLYDKDSTLY